jgi:phosphoserine phosphatase
MKDKKCRFYCYKKTREKINLTVGKMKNLDLIVFDMDGVLADTISSWKYIHDFFNTSNDISVDNYLKGKIDDDEFIRRDASKWVENGKPIKKERLVEILSDIPVIEGASECIKSLRGRGVKTAIVSAGLDILAGDFQRRLGIDYVFSNGIETDRDGRLNGKGIIQVRLMYKDEAIKKLANNLKISYDKIAAVGNSCFDIPMFEMAGLGIAFNPSDDCVREAADIVVEEKDLRKILPYLERFII